MRTSVRCRPRAHDRRRFWLAILAATLLAACEPMQRADGPAVTAGASRATELARQGRHDESAERWLALAEEAGEPARERYLILAARQLRLAGKLGSAQQILDSLDDPVDESNRLGWSQVAGDLAIARGQPERALEILAQAPPTSKPRIAAELARIQGEALFRLDDPAGATQAYLDREVWLSDPEQIAANQRLLWNGYQRWGGSITPAMIADVDDPVVAGWLQLGSIAASRRDSEAGLGLALTGWQSRFPEHPANDVLLPELLRDYRGIAAMPERVALLLPLSGRHQSAGRAVREGFLAAHFEAQQLSGERGPEIRIYDVAASGPVAAQQAAAADGAQFTVGPLVKESVQALAAQGLAMPTLALNYLPDEVPAPPALFEFALAPEDEAVQAADRAIAAGQRRALVLAPNNSFGRRLLNSFMTTYEALGGTLIDYRFFDPTSPDYSYGMQQLLLIGESRDRHERLSANLGIDLGFEPRRRDDIDLIFLAAGADAAKLIRPQLKFYYAGDVPTYATSAIFQEGSRSNSDLNGIMFADMPWIVEPDTEIRAVRDTLTGLWPDASRASRLFAMGFDAYRLVPDLASAAIAGGQEIAGVTGRLYLGADGRIHRRLVWAQIRRGNPVRVDEPTNVPQAARETE